MKKVSLRKAWSKTKKFVKENKLQLFQISLMVGIAALSTDSALANAVGKAEGNADQAFNAITGPLDKMQTLMTGKVPAAIGTIGAGIAGASWAFNIENQMTKAGMRVIGGTGVAIGAESVLNGATAVLLL